jgi:polyhydroxybutyrate depolymerase
LRPWSSVLLAMALLAPSARAQDCGGPDAPCRLALGEYHARAPQPPSEGERLPAVVHFHGAGASGAAVIGDAALVEPILTRGYVVIAPTGLVPPGRTGGGWSLGARPRLRDELAFVREVLTDAETRFHIDRSRVLLTGFSIGGSLVWYLACEAPDDFAACAPVAGGFWRPQPDDCAGPVKLLHTHGWRDQTVPIEGRPLRPGLEQSDIFEGLQLWRRLDGCTGLRADTFATDARFWRRAWTDCAPGTALELVLHPGGHEVPAGWASMALDWFERVVPGPH